MYQIIHRDLSAVGNLINPVIKFFGRVYLEHSIDNIVMNKFFLSTIHNFIDKSDARYRYLEQIPHAIAAVIYYVGLVCFSFIINICTLKSEESCKQLCITAGIQITFALLSLSLSVMGSLSPSVAMNISLFYGEKIIEIFDADKDETEKVCDFIKNFWSSYRIRIQDWMICAQKLTPQNVLNYQMRVMDMHRKLKNLSDVRNLFQYALQLKG